MRCSCYTIANASGTVWFSLLTLIVYQCIGFPHIHRFPQAIPYLITKDRVWSSHTCLKQLPFWAPCSIATAIGLLNPDYMKHEEVARYALRVLATYPASKVTFYASQLVQALRHDASGHVEDYLVQACDQDAHFAHRVIWILEVDAPCTERYTKSSTCQCVLARILCLLVVLFMFCFNRGKRHRQRQQMRL